MIRQTIALVGAMLLAILLGGGMLNLAVAEANGATRTEYMPCVGNDTERNCVWDNRHGGKGDGFRWSFFVDEQGRVYRLPHHIAHALLNR